MSGPHAQYRTPSRPLIVGGEPVLKVDKHGNPDCRYVLEPGGTYVSGRCVDYKVRWYVATRHVLDYRPQPAIPGKHSRGRVRPLDAKARAKRERLHRKLTQAQKTITVDQATLGAAYDEA